MPQPQALTISAGKTIVLDDNPSATLAPAFVRSQLTTFSDLAKFGVIKSADTVKKLLDASKAVTADALKNPGTFQPFVPIVGMSTVDLRRYGAVVAATPSVTEFERSIFWRVFRDIDAPTAATVKADSKLVDFNVDPSQLSFNKYLFANVTVEQHAVLQIDSSVNALVCHDLLIRKLGKVVTVGGGLRITAFSIKGEQ
jgi:hypothetical protein